MAKRISATIRDYIYDQVFPLHKHFSGMNKSARIEELLSKGLEKEKEELKENEEEE